jgi:hypothetical protein
VAANCRFIVFTILVFALAGCHKRVRNVTVPPPPSPELARVPPLPPPSKVEDLKIDAPDAPVSPAPLTPPEVVELRSANLAYENSDFQDATRHYENYLQLAPDGEQRDYVLLQLAMIQVSKPAPDWSRGTAWFKQLVEEYPRSPYAPVASTILTLNSQLAQAREDARQRDRVMNQLKGELDRIKKLDADRRRNR